MHRVLLISSNGNITSKQLNSLNKSGYICHSAENEESALELIHEKKPDVIVNEMHEPGEKSIELIEIAQKANPNIPVIFISKKGNIQNAIDVLKAGAFDYIPNPVSIKKLVELINDAASSVSVDDNAPVADIDTTDSTFLKDVFGNSKAINEVAERVQKVAQSDANVFIYGESGTGKELIAKNIHRLSKRKEQPFIPLDCVALPSSLLESEIFGFEEGAFTGAVKSKPGVIELADSGTLFLDEIIELPLFLQTKLLRVLQERQFRRIGGTKLKNVNLRIISASNIDPRKALEASKLREDLYYRLNVVPISLPPLRKRKEDIPILTEHFIKKFNPSCPREITGITNEALRYMKKYDWPGNIRELQNAVENAMSMTDSNKLCLKDLPEYIVENKIIASDEEFEDIDFKSAKNKYLNLFYGQYFDRLFKKHNGNISKIAKEAGISRRTIYRILNNLNES
ncbi:response regulator [candidate division KSB1 bacterium]|nr:response regulator [candidate division KSB1 bacterium]